METRKRAAVPKAKPKSLPPTSCSSCLAAVRRDALHQATVSSAGQHLGLELAHAAVQPQHRRLADGDVQIAGPLADDRLQQLVNEDRTH